MGLWWLGKHTVRGFWDALSVPHPCLPGWVWDCILSQPHHLEALRGSLIFFYLLIWQTKRITFFNFAFP